MSDASPDHLRAGLRRDLAIAIRQRDAVTVSALRTARAAIENAEAVSPSEADAALPEPSPVAGSVVGLGAGEAPRRELTADDVERIVRGERSERAERLRAEARVLDRYL